MASISDRGAGGSRKRTVPLQALSHAHTTRPGAEGLKMTERHRGWDGTLCREPGQAVAGRPFDITCMFPYKSAFTKSLRAKGCRVFIAPLRDDPQWCAIETAVALVGRYRVDLIHADRLNAHTLGAITGSLTRTPVVSTTHSMAIESQKISVSRLMHTQMWWRASRHGHTRSRSAFLPSDSHPSPTAWTPADSTRRTVVWHSVRRLAYRRMHS
jgi:hypothetical protein